MRVVAILNNFQIGSYPYKVLSNKIQSKYPFDSHHTEVIWVNVEQWEFNLLKRVVKNAKIIKD